MKRIGIIGVGELGRALVHGLCEGDGEGDGEAAPEVFLSPRGARAGAELSARYASVTVCADNQAVADRAEILIIAVRRKDRHEAVGGLRVPPGTTVINAMAGVGTDDLRRTLAPTDAPLVRAIPLPTVAERRSVTVTCPSHPVADAFFDHLGGTLPVADEADFNIFSAVTGSLTTHYAYLTTLTTWLTTQGVPADGAERYVRSLFEGVGRSLADETSTLAQLAASHETPGGNNERIRTTWFTPTNIAALHEALDALLADLRKRV